MGFGASLAGGCTIGNGLVQTAMFSWQGWISLAFTIFGVWTASYFVFVRPNKKKSTVSSSVEAKSAIEEIASGEDLVINFDCTQGTESIPKWAAEAGHSVTNFEQIGEAAWTITVQKK